MLIDEMDIGAPLNDSKNILFEPIQFEMNSENKKPLEEITNYCAKILEQIIDLNFVIKNISFLLKKKEENNNKYYKEIINLEEGKLNKMIGQKRFNKNIYENFIDSNANKYTNEPNKNSLYIKSISDNNINNNLFFLSKENEGQELFLEDKKIISFLNKFKIKFANKIMTNNNINISPTKAFRPKISTFYGELGEKFIEVYEENSKGKYSDIDIKDDNGKIILIYSKPLKPNTLLFFLFGEIKYLKNIKQKKKLKNYNTHLLLYETKNKDYSRFIDFSKFSNVAFFIIKTKDESKANCCIKRIYFDNNNTYLIIYTSKTVKKNDMLILYDKI